MTQPRGRGLIVLVAAIIVAGLAIAYRTRQSPAPNAASSAATGAGPSETFSLSFTATPLATSVALAPKPTVGTPDMPVSPASPPTTLDMPPPPLDGSGLYTAPPQKPITPEWELEKTKVALAGVQARSSRLEKEIADLERAGKSQEAAEKKILLKRLNAQIASMHAEMEQFKIDAGLSNATPPQP